MKACSGYQELISAYVDGELTESDKKNLETHLNNCESCSALLALYREIPNAVAESAVPAPDMLCSGVMAKIISDDAASIAENGRRRKVIRVVLTRYLPVAACLAIVLLALPRILNYNRSTGDSQQNLKAEMSYAINQSAVYSGGGDMVGDAGAVDGVQDSDRALVEEETENASTAGTDNSASFDAPGEAGVQAAPPPNIASGSGTTGGSFTIGSPTNGEPEIAVDDEIRDMPAMQDQIADNGGMLEATPDRDEAEAPFDSDSQAIIWITGDLPDFLLRFERIVVDDVTSHFIIPCDAAMALLREISDRDGVVADIPDGDWDYAIVIYRADR